MALKHEFNKRYLQSGAWIRFEKRSACWFCGRRNICRQHRYVGTEHKFLLGKDMCNACDHRFTTVSIREWEPLVQVDTLDIEPEEMEVMRMISACGMLMRKVLRESGKASRRLPRAPVPPQQNGEIDD